ncbi:MAG: hypothetical protein AVDCRST_MAG14-719 [uncultured Rubrobacteraceae bacterium]|uniref:Uncharacterized protein n=1 Tax=uncultured Rubrobacteraceae bacterium TaxID=349277 RepID=A0A6J4QX95_9ACTN|nr:MAG: hypothetical protein AVDCRST_MAG14-719 [uncultured Rubrobacteraceae bacterium]
MIADGSVTFYNAWFAFEMLKETQYGVGSTRLAGGGLG